MKFQTLQSKFKDTPLFNKMDLRFFEENENNLNLNIKYWVKNGKIIRLKRGWYTLADEYKRRKNKELYLKIIANELVKPSYLSAEYILNKYGVLTEAVFGITSITTKIKREIENDLGVFRYYSISEKLFKGYLVKEEKGKFTFEATLPKALFDFLYIRFFRDVEATLKALDNLRINWENISYQDFLKSKKYLAEARSKNMEKLYNIIERKKYAD